MIRTLAFAAKNILSPQGRVFYLPMANPRGSPPHITCVRLNLPGDSIHIGSAGFGDSFGLVRRPGCGEVDAWQLSINKAVLARSI